MVTIQPLDNRTYLVSAPMIPEGITVNGREDARNLAAMFSEVWNARMLRRRERRLAEARARANAWGR